MKGQMRLSNKLGQVVQLKNGKVISSVTIDRVYMVNKRTTGHIVNQKDGSTVKVNHINNECWRVA